MSNIFFGKLLPQICPKCWSRQLLLNNRRCLLSDRNIRYAPPAEDDLNSASTAPPAEDDLNSSGSSSHSDRDREENMELPGALYPHHIPTTSFQKALLSFGAATAAITSPWRGDMVAALGETTSRPALIYMRSKMLADPVGSQILQEQPRINTRTVEMNYLRSLPEGTFGRIYVDWLDKNKASPDEREPVHFVDDLDLAYVMTRYRETHDLFHTVLGMPTNMLGEVVVKWVEAIQLGLPMCATAALFGPVRLGPKHMQRYLETHLWWALRNGWRARFLMNIYYEKHWDEPIESLREQLNIEPPPFTPARKHGT